MPLIPQAGTDPAGLPGADMLSQLPAEDCVRLAIEAAQAALNKLPDDLESADVVKAIQFLYKVAGGRQQGQEAALGTTPALKHMGRAYQQGGGQGGAAY